MEKWKLFEETVEWKERKGGGSIGCRRCRAPALQVALVNPRYKGFYVVMYASVQMQAEGNTCMGGSSYGLPRSKIAARRTG